jgi:hypothetical protein
LHPIADGNVNVSSHPANGVTCTSTAACVPSLSTTEIVQLLVTGLASEPIWQCVMPPSSHDTGPPVQVVVMLSMGHDDWKCAVG